MDEVSPFDLREQAETQEEADKRKRLLQLQDDTDIQWLMEHKQGRRVVWRVLGIAGLYRNPMQGDGDAFTNLRCGMQAVGQTLVADIHRLCPQSYFDMVKEQQGSGNGNADDR